MDYRGQAENSSSDDSTSGSPASGTPDHAQHQHTSAVDHLLSQLSIEMTGVAGGGATGGGATGGGSTTGDVPLSKDDFMNLVSSLATTSRYNAEQAQTNTANLTKMIETLQGSNLGHPPRMNDPKFSQSTFKDLILTGSDEEKLESLISWENGVRRICDARGWPNDPHCTLTMLVSAVMSGFTTAAERLTQSIVPAECTSLDDFFNRVRTAALGTAVSAKAMSMFHSRKQRPGESLNMFHSTLLTIFKIVHLYLSYTAYL